MAEDFRNPDSAAAPAEAAPPPLRAAFLVWPGKSHSQTWLFLWAGVAYVIGALLPWQGHGADTYVLSNGTSLEAARYEFLYPAGLTDASKALPPIVAVHPKRMNLGVAVLLLSAICMVVAGLRSVWNRRLIMAPVLCTWFIALILVHFYGCPNPDPGFQDVLRVRGWSQLTDAVGESFASFGDLFGGAVPTGLTKTVGRAGVGFYLTAFTTIFLLLFVIGSLFAGKKKPADEKLTPARRVAPPKK